MMWLTTSSSSPLYQLFQGEHNSFTYRSTEVTGAHIYDYFHTNNAADNTRYRFINDTTYTQYSNPITTTWFSCHAGDILTLKMKNITFVNLYNGAATSYGVNVRDTSNALVINTSLSVASNKTSTPDDVVVTSTLVNDVDIAAIRLYQQRKSTMTYDLELWVNDIRYI